jgi:hypothetical protein
MFRNLGTCPTTLDGWRRKRRINKTRVLLPRGDSTAGADGLVKIGANAAIFITLYLQIQTATPIESEFRSASHSDEHEVCCGDAPSHHQRWQVRKRSCCEQYSACLLFVTVNVGIIFKIIARAISGRDTIT